MYIILVAAKQKVRFALYNSEPVTVSLYTNQPDMKATWNNHVIAESDDTIVVENNHYFPQSSIKQEYFKECSTQTTCPWKGLASYYTLEVDGKQNPDAAWYYSAPKPAAANIANYVAFWKGVKVTN